MCAHMCALPYRRAFSLHCEDGGQTSYPTPFSNHNTHTLSHIHTCVHIHTLLFTSDNACDTIQCLVYALTSIHNRVLTEESPASSFSFEIIIQ